MTNWDSHGSGHESIPPPPTSDPGIHQGNDTSIPPPPSAKPKSSDGGEAAGAGCLSVVGAIAILLSVLLFGAARSVRSDPNVLASSFAEFLTVAAQGALFIGAVLLLIGLVVLKRLRR